MNRRDFIALVGGAAASPLGASAQQAAKIARIGFLTFNLAPNRHLLEAFRQGLHDLGYVEGRNVIIEVLDADGKLDRLPALASEMVAREVDAILTGGQAQALAAKQATTTLPIVFAQAANPIESGLVASLARPGGNVTGLSNLNAILVGKCLDLLKQAVPRVGRVAVLWPPGNLGERTEKEMLTGADISARALVATR